jgi:hypothetical protein
MLIYVCIRVGVNKIYVRVCRHFPWYKVSKRFIIADIFHTSLTVAAEDSIHPRDCVSTRR